MKKINVLLLVSAMGFSALASVLAWGEFQKVQSNAAKNNVTTTVFVVASNVPDHQLIQASDVTQKKVPVDSVEPGALTSLSQVVNHYTSSQWFKGQQVIAPMITPATSQSAFPASIPDGDLAFTLSDDAVTGVDHLISPGDHVDVVAALPDKNGKVVKTILQDILVLYVDSKPQVNPSGPATVNAQNAQPQSTTTVDTITLALSPMQIEQVEYAEVSGQVRLALRSPTNSATTNLSPVSQSNAG